MNIRMTSNATRAAAVLVTLAAAAGCASTSVSNQQQMAVGPLPRPGQIWVYPFAATPVDVRPESALVSDPEVVAGQQSPEQIAEGRKLGAQIATQVVQEIIGMGMPAAVGSAASRPQLNDLVFEGSLLSVQQGSAAERVSIGFSAGQSELKVAVEAYQMTTMGLRKLGSGDVTSTGNKTPGMAVGIASWAITKNPAGFILTTGMKSYGELSGSNTIEGRAQQISKKIGAQLNTRFQEQGWISGGS
jgi:Domain of unknown function (DUF4410)